MNTALRHCAARFSIAGALVLSVALAACGGSAVPTTSSRAGGKAVVALDSLPFPPDPGLAPGFNSWYIIQNIAQPLLEVNLLPDGKTETVPVLAESWKTTDDGSVWTIKLRRGVKFHDGTAFNADAVLFSHDRLMNKGGLYYNTLYAAIGAPLNGMVAKIEAPDDYTVRFTLKDPANSAFPLWERRVMMVSPTAVKKYGKDFGSHLVGTGPFKLDNYDGAAQVVETSKNPTYWEPGLPKLDKVIWRVVSDATTRLAQLQSGEADFAVGLAPAFTGQISGNADLVLRIVNVPQFNQIQFWTDLPPFDKKEVRQAVAYALDRKTLTKLLYGDAFAPAINNRWFGLQGWSDYAPYSYDPVKAKALLKEAGYPDGLDFTLIMPSSSGANPAGKRWAEAISEQLGKVGFRVKLQVIDTSSYWSGLNTPKPNVAFFMNRGVWVGDVANEWLLNWSAPLPFARVPVPGMPERMTTLNRTAAPGKRDQEIQEMWKLIDDYLPYIAISRPSWVMASRKSLQDVRLVPLGEWMQFKKAHL